MRKKNFQIQESGQALLESLLVHAILFLCVFGVIEVARLFAFKSCLQGIVSDLAYEISLSHLELKRRGVVPQQPGIHQLQENYFQKKIAQKINTHLKLFETSKLSFDHSDTNPSKGLLFVEKNNFRIYLSFVNWPEKGNNLKKSSGVYLKVNACLPVLFSGYFRTFLPQQNNPIGASLQQGKSSQDRNCLGQSLGISNFFSPLFWFRVRVAAFVPWPASSSIFEKGFAIPEKMKFFSHDEYRNEVLKAIEEENLILYFKNPRKEKF